MQAALMALLLADTALAALVNGRIYWDAIDQGAAAPAVVMYLISDVPDYHMAGANGFIESRVQIDVRAEKYNGGKASAYAVAQAVEAVLSAYSGTVGSIRFAGIFRLNARAELVTTGAETFAVASADYQIFTGSAG